MGLFNSKKNSEAINAETGEECIWIDGFRSQEGLSMGMKVWAIFNSNKN